MKVELKKFQDVAVGELLNNARIAIGNYNQYQKRSVIAFTAPTGAGKTIMMTSFIEDILFGREGFPERPNSIFVWLSDSPQLNEQSKDKILSKSDKMTFGQCETITPDGFKAEVLEDGKVYFLNTELMAKGNRIVTHSDGRQWTIWQVLTKTIEDKGDRLYFIIDEAHRGARDSTAAKQTAIMQRFLKGWQHEDGFMPPMPVVIGMSATIKRFRTLVSSIGNVGILPVDVPIAQVKDSGLLKERICAHYDDSGVHVENNMAVLAFAAMAWKNKCDHWDQYCREMHYAYINPALIVQVENGNDAVVSKTDLDQCVQKIEEVVGRRFEAGEVVHAFGPPKDAVTMNGLQVNYLEPSKISADNKAKVIFFKEGLSTGWDCPRAEVIMSFRKAEDDTNIAQLLGRLIRMPRQEHVKNDGALNEVDIFLPNFNRGAVRGVVDQLKDEEGAELPTEVEDVPLNANDSRILVLEPPPVVVHSGAYLPPRAVKGGVESSVAAANAEGSNGEAETEFKLEGESVPVSVGETASTTQSESRGSGVGPVVRSDNEPAVAAPQTVQPLWVSEFDRKRVRDFINRSNIKTFRVRTVQTSSYLKSLFDISSLLIRSGVHVGAYDEVKDEIVGLMYGYIDGLKRAGRYDEFSEKVRKFQLCVEIFDPFGEHAARVERGDLLAATETDIDNQYRIAEGRMGKSGIGGAYGRRYLNEDDPQAWKVDVIICVAEQPFAEQLEKYAKKKYLQYQENYRVRLTQGPKSFCDEYRGIVFSASTVCPLPYILPDRPFDGSSGKGIKYSRHLFVTEKDGSIKFDLKNWEQKTIAHESERDDFVCWLRNPQKANSWALGYAYGQENEKHGAFPDFIVVRRDPGNPDGYLIDILEPHGEHLEDNLEKARGLAWFAEENPMLSRVEMIRVVEDKAGHTTFKRMNLANPAVRARLAGVHTNDELSDLFEVE